MDKFDFNEAEILYSTWLDYLFFINKETCKFYYCYLNNENPKAIALNLNIPTSIKKVSVQDKIILPNTIQYGKNKNEENKNKKDKCIEICNTLFENDPIIVEYEQDNFTRFLVIPFPNNPK